MTERCETEAQGMCLVAANFNNLSVGGDNGAPPNPLAGFEGPLRRRGRQWKRTGGRRKGKGKKDVRDERKHK